MGPQSKIEDFVVTDASYNQQEGLVTKLGAIRTGEFSTLALSFTTLHLCDCLAERGFPKAAWRHQPDHRQPARARTSSLDRLFVCS